MKESKEAASIKKSLEHTKNTVKDAFIVGFDAKGNKLTNAQIKKLL